MCHIICSEPNSPTFGWGIPHYFFSQSGLQNPHNGENSPLLDTLTTLSEKPTTATNSSRTTGEAEQEKGLLISKMLAHCCLSQGWPPGWE